MSLSNAICADLLDLIFSGTAVSFTPGTAYASLTTTPGGTEVSGTGYTRQSVTFGAATSAQPSVASANEIDFGTVAGDWSPVASIDTVDFYDAASSGNLMFSGVDGSPITYSTGNRAFVAAGATLSVGTNSIFAAAYLQDIVDYLVNAGGAPSQLQYAGLLNSGTELTGGNYARLDCNALWASATVADPSVKAFTAVTTFTASATYTGTANQIGFYTAASGGSPLCTVAVSSQSIGSGDLVEINPTVSLT